MVKAKYVRCFTIEWYTFSFQRFQFSDDKVPWSVDFPDYKPVEYTTKKIQNNPKADPIDA